MSDDRHVVVIGSGPTGAMAALTMVEEGIRVTMLESGRRLPRGCLVRIAGRNVVRRRPPIVDPGAHVASDDETAAWFHAECPGGMSNHWDGAVPRFAPEDFFEGASLDERYRWPVDYADLAPYYERVERLMEISGSSHSTATQPANSVRHERDMPGGWAGLVETASARGHALVPLPLATGPSWAVRSVGVGFNSYSHIVQPLEASPLFTLLTGAHAVQLNWRGDRRRVGSVAYYDQGAGCEKRIEAAAFIVCCGALASTKLLLQSKSADFPAGLGDTEGLLGHYLHDHSFAVSTITLDKPLEGLSQAAVLTRSRYDGHQPLRGAECVIGHNSAINKLRGLTPRGCTEFGLWVFGTMVPRHRNFVALDPCRTDAFGYPALRLHIRFDADTHRTSRNARDRLAEIFESAGYGCTLGPAAPALVPGESIHYGGSIRMHTSPSHGMLDASNRLHAVPNVVVADSSCFTTGPEKNPTLTSMAVAARASHRMAADIRMQ